MPHSPHTQLVLASNNAGKLGELNALFEQAALPLTVISQGSLGIAEADETGLSFIENALIKARHASRLAQLPALADDSGLCVDVLGGAPGIYSARFGGEHGNDALNNQTLLTALKPHRDQSPLSGQFVCALALVRHADDPLPIVVQATWSGHILDAEQGGGGFGYDPLFWIPALQQTSSQLTPDRKNQLSHRARALRDLITQLAHRPLT